MSKATHIVTDKLPATLKPTVEDELGVEHKLAGPPDPLGLDITNDGLWAVTAPGELFKPGQRWRIARVIGPGFDEGDRILINRDASDGDMRAHIARCIGEVMLELSGIEGDNFPALAAFVPESAKGIESPGYPQIRVPDELWPRCWGNPQEGSDGKRDDFGDWLWDQPFKCADGRDHAKGGEA